MREYFLKDSLRKAIDSWLEENCETDEWQNLGIYVPPNISELMVEAVFLILSTCKDSVDYYGDNY